MTGKGVTRRDVLIGGSAAGVIAASGAHASFVDLKPFAKRHLTIFRDYADHASSPRPNAPKDRLDAPDDLPRVLWVSDLAPSSFAHHRHVLLLRPAVLATAPVERLADWLSRDGPVVLSAPSGAFPSDPSALWQRLAELLAAPATPDEAFLDLGGHVRDDDAILDGIDLFRRTYAAKVADPVAVACPQGPILPIG